MGTGFREYLSRGYYRKIEKRIDVKAIVICWAFNIGVALVVFAAVWYSTLNPFASVMYTMYSWACTLILSVLYWLFWISRKLESARAKVTASLLIVFMLAAGLLIVWQMVNLITQLALL